MQTLSAPKTSFIGSQVMLLILGIAWLILGSGVLAYQFLQDQPVVVTWETETEYDTAGFNIYRSLAPDGEFEQINAQLIPSAADPAAGESYSYTDTNVERGVTYYYKLEDVEYNNTRTQHEIIEAAVPTVQLSAILLASVCFVVGFLLLYTGLRNNKSV